MFTPCVSVNMYGVATTLTKASVLPGNTLINLVVVVLRAEPAVLSALFPGIHRLLVYTWFAITNHSISTALSGSWVSPASPSALGGEHHSVLI